MGAVELLAPPDAVVPCWVAPALPGPLVTTVLLPPSAPASLFVTTCVVEDDEQADRTRIETAITRVDEFFMLSRT
jgi:hypothetical protein